MIHAFVSISTDKELGTSNRSLMQINFVALQNVYISLNQLNTVIVE